LFKGERYKYYLSLFDVTGLHVGNHLFQEDIIVMNIGIRADDIEAASLEELVNAVSEKGLTSVQLALSKSLKNINTDSGALSPGFARYIGDAFRARDIQNCRPRLLY
jgi:hypothetical protein